MGAEVTRYWPALLFLVCSLLVAAPAEAAKVRILFENWDGPPIKVFIARPSGLKPDRPVVFVMHGVGRNAEEYRDQWHELALAHDFLLLVPEFNRADFAGADGYNLGSVFDNNGSSRLRALWSFSAIESIFDDVRRRFEMTTDAYSIYGHSAGAQFVHRFLFHVPNARLIQAVAANAGWYTMPDFDVEFPYGLKDSAVSREQLAGALQLPVTILLGDQDTDPEHPSLRRTPEVMAQGDHRVARGMAFFDAARNAALDLDVPFAWRVSIVEGADHDNRLMAPAAVTFLLKESGPAEP